MTAFALAFLAGVLVTGVVMCVLFGDRISRAIKRTLP